MIDLQEAIERFDTALPREIQLEFSSDEFMAALQAAGDRYGVSLIGTAILLAIGEIEYEKLEAYLIDELAIDPAQAAGMANDLKDKVFQPVVDRLKFLDTDPEKAMTLEQQKNFAEKIFSSGLVSELRHDPFIISSINARLFYILARDEAFAGRLERALYGNSETISAKTLVFDGLQNPGTVATWLKDYLRQFGNAADDSVSQTNFLLNSENAKGLPAEERALLAKVLKTYVNIKFFPDSMPSDDGSGWEILPGGDETTAPALIDNQTGPAADSEVLPPQSSLPPRPAAPAPAYVPVPQSAQPPQKVAASVRPAAPRPQPKNELPPLKPAPAAARPKPRPAAPVDLPVTDSRPAVTAAPFVPENDELLHLKNMLLQYPAGSLERSAIEDEIRKLGN